MTTWPRRAYPGRLPDRAKRDEAPRPEIQGGFRCQLAGLGRAQSSGESCAAMASMLLAAPWLDRWKPWIFRRLSGKAIEDDRPGQEVTVPSEQDEPPVPDVGAEHAVDF